MEKNQKIYRFSGLDTAVRLLRPNAIWEITGGNGSMYFSKWEDSRPQPSIEEVKEVQRLMREVEDKINTIYTEEQIKEHNKHAGIT